MRDKVTRPNVCRWFEALEARDTYMGMQSDFHTHAHDLPPQMGGCYFSGGVQQQKATALVDSGPYLAVQDSSVPEPPDACAEAIFRVARHKDKLMQANPHVKALGGAALDEAIRAGGPSVRIAPPRRVSR